MFKGGAHSPSNLEKNQQHSGQLSPLTRSICLAPKRQNAQTKTTS